MKTRSKPGCYTHKEMFDSLTKLFEGNNINQKMNLRNQLKNVKIQNTETI